MSTSTEENTFMVVNRVHFVVGFCASVKQFIFEELGGLPTVEITDILLHHILSHDRFR